MKRTLNRLSALQAKTLKKQGRHADGGNLYLKITSDGRRWVFMYIYDGKQREMGLGSAGKGGVSLGDARTRAGEARDALKAGIDPMAAKKETKQRMALANAPTFGKVADEYLAVMKPSWRNAKHAAQWSYTLKKLAAPLRPKRINQIQTADVLEVLQPLWQSLPETASRLRGRIENVLDAARAKGYRQGENPARWRGHLSLLLPKRQKLAHGHHAALPFEQLPDFMAKLTAGQSLAAKALELTILSACRTGEVIGARWGEIDLDKRLWIIPSERMKAGKEHRVPLSERALSLLKELSQVKRGQFVFPAGNAKRHLSSMAMSMLLRRMKADKITVHGFRSTFRDWTSEQTSFPTETCEHALAHGISDKVEAAYRRGDQFEKRQKLMTAWADYCEPDASGKVIPLRERAKR